MLNDCSACGTERRCVWLANSSSHNGVPAVAGKPQAPALVLRGLSVAAETVQKGGRGWGRLLVTHGVRNLVRGGPEDEQADDNEQRDKQYIPGGDPQPAGQGQEQDLLACGRRLLTLFVES